MISIIIPCYNEQSNVAKVINDLHELNSDFNIIIINDASTDLTSENAKNTNKAMVIDLPVNLGVGGAVQTGFIKALKLNCDYAVKFDGDCQHLPEYINDLLMPLINHEADITVGTRYLNNDSDGYKSTFLRKRGINLLQFMSKILTGTRFTDPTSGFRAYNRKAISFMAKHYPNFDYPEPEEIILASKNNLKMIEVPVKMSERLSGKSSISSFGGIYYMIKAMLAMFFVSLRKPEKTEL